MEKRDSYALTQNRIRPFRMRLTGRRLPFFALLVLLRFATPLLSQPAPGDTDPAPEPKKKSSLRVAVLPILSYRPETRWNFGAGGVINFRLGHTKEQTRPSSLWLRFIYTQNKQLFIRVSPELYLPKNQFVLNFNLSYVRFPTDFYGIGNGVSFSNSEEYTPRIFRFEVVLNKRILPHLYAGLGYYLDKTTMESITPGGLLASGAIAGSTGGLVSGLGIHASWDTRDNVIYPHQGIMFSLISYLYSSAFGSKYNYTMLALDFRYYTPVVSSHVFAFQAYFKSLGGNAPFYNLAQLGGSNTMRGYFQGFYRDRTLTLCQAEYRLPVWWRFGVVAFAGVGEVSSGLDDFHLHNLKYALGTGIRFKLDKREGTNLRLDWAWGEGQHAFYLAIQESF